MKIKDILGEAGAVATIKDYKPGQSLSFTDQEGSTMTTIDLKKNPMAVKPDAQGKLTYDPTPDSQAAVPGQSQAPEIKPGAQINIDTATTEGSGSKMEELFSDWMSSEYAPYNDDAGDDAAVFIKALNFVADRMDNRSDSESYAYKLANMFHGDDETYNDFSENKPGFTGVPARPQPQPVNPNSPMLPLAPGRPTFVKAPIREAQEKPEPTNPADRVPSRMDESAYITALAKRVAGTDAKVSESANKSIADIRKLAGL